VVDDQKFWALSDSDTSTRRWQLIAVDGSVVDELPIVTGSRPIPYGREVLLASPSGTTAFDLVTRRAREVSKTPVVAAAGATVLGLDCPNLCQFSVIDTVTHFERVALLSTPREAATASLSPDGTSLAIARYGNDILPHVQIVDTASGATRWQSPSVVPPGPGPVMAWAPDASWLLVKMSDEHVTAISVRDHSFRQVDIALSLAPGHGMVVTRK
jgi:hypothetical protein